MKEAAKGQRGTVESVEKAAEKQRGTEKMCKKRGTAIAAEEISHRMQTAKKKKFSVRSE